MSTRRNMKSNFSQAPWYTIIILRKNIARRQKSKIQLALDFGSSIIQNLFLIRLWTVTCFHSSWGSSENWGMRHKSKRIVAVSLVKSLWGLGGRGGGMQNGGKWKSYSVLKGDKRFLKFFNGRYGGFIYDGRSWSIAGSQNLDWDIEEYVE